MNSKITGITLLASLLVSNAAYPANAEAGKALSAQCVGCHGTKGISPTGSFPNLAGQKVEYLTAQLKALKAKTRVAPVMNAMAVGLKDEDIDNLSAYYASLKACE
jgi:cytochrome c553